MVSVFLATSKKINTFDSSENESKTKITTLKRVIFRPYDRNDSIERSNLK